MQVPPNRRHRFFTAVMVCGAMMAVAQTTNQTALHRSLSLGECLDMALKRNLQLQIEHLSPQIAQYDLNSAYGPYDPQLSFQAGSQHIAAPSDFDPRKPHGYRPYDENIDTFGPELTGRLPSGTSIDLSASAGGKNATTDLNFTEYAADYPNGLRSTNNYYAQAELTLRQHLLKDFWIDSYRETLLFRKDDLKMSQEALRMEIMKMVLAVELTYYDVLAARQKITVEEMALQLKRQFLAQTRRRVEVGESPPLDIEMAQSQLQTTLTALSAARQMFVEQQNNLIALITDDFRLWGDIDLEPVGSLEALKEEPTRFTSFQNALTKRPDLAAARLAVDKSNVAVRFEKNQLFPTLDLVSTYGVNSVETGQSSAISDVVHLRGPNYSAGVVVSFPLANVGARNTYKASQAQRKLAELQLKKAEQDVLVQVADYVSGVPSQFTQTESTHLARVYAESALAAEQKKLEAGLTTGFIVLEYQEALTAARNAEIDALADYNKTVAQLAFAEGTILERRHLSVEVR